MKNAVEVLEVLHSIDGWVSTISGMNLLKKFFNIEIAGVCYKRVTDALEQYNLIECRKTTKDIECKCLK
jgi:hypothetical protein